MVNKIVSFGFKHPLPPLAISSTVILDVRKMFRNPYFKPELRNLRGTDKAVQDEIRLTPHFDTLVRHLVDKASVPGINEVWVGCTGGRHRAPFIAELIGKELGVKVVHRDINE